MGENISQEDLNMKFLRSLPTEWNNHVVFWRNKADLDTMNIDYLYNNVKIVEQQVKRTVTSSSSLGSQNMAFLSSFGGTNEVNTANIQVSTISTPVSIVSSHDNTSNLSDATVYTFLANLPNGEYKSPRNQKSRPRNEDSSRKTVNVEDTYSKAMVAIDGAGFDWSYMADDEVPTNMALIAFSDSEPSMSVSVDTSNEIKKAFDSSIIKDWVSDSDLDESEVMVLKFDNVQHKPEQANQPRKGDPQDALKDTKIFDSGCPRHITGNKSYLIHYQEYDGGFVAFASGSQGDV
nr:hypothetical protein [Tanacetum cinerariifolium]